MEEGEGNDGASCGHKRVNMFVLNECADCCCKLDLHRLKQERRHVESMRKKDERRRRLPLPKQFHGVRVDWLLAFAFDHVSGEGRRRMKRRVVFRKIIVFPFCSFFVDTTPLPLCIFSCFCALALVFRAGMLELADMASCSRRYRSTHFEN